ncbi:MAG TPA: hypothetical protein VF824_10260 [Thermoanaerobaculia bacterium]|jgi:hypothetical protein
MSKKDLAALAGMSDEAVEKATGRTWAQWVAYLDDFGAKVKEHRDVATHLSSIGVKNWWSQMVTVGYERIRGLRAVGQRRAGTWEATKTRTVAVPVDRLYDAFAEAKQRARWLRGVKLNVRTATRPKSMRITMDDGTDLQLGFYAKGDGKSSVAIQHAKLADKKTADEMKVFWSERLDALVKMLTS